jgi:hypothetical protein
MKARISPYWGLGMALAVTVAVHGFADALGPSAKAASEPTGTASTSPPTAPQSSPTTTALPSHTEPQSLPANPALSTWSLEIQRLVQAAVEERVILLYITNSAGVFNLSPDQIIYLKNASVSPSVLNAMIWHDQKLVAGNPSPAGAATPPNILTPLPPPSGEGILTTIAEAEPGELLASDEDYYAPDQPASTGPVRAPYAVRLNDPIVILRLPTFTVPYW